MNMAAKTLNLTLQGIQDCCHSRSRFSQGFIWIFKKDFKNNPNLIQEKVKKVKQKRKLIEEHKRKIGIKSSRKRQSRPKGVTEKN